MTDHRDRAEQWLASAAQEGSAEHTTADATTGALHALLAIHDLLAERLPQSPELWTVPEYTCPGCPDSAQNAAQGAAGGDSGTQGRQGGSEAHSGDSDIRPEPESVTLPRGVVDVAWARLEVAASDPDANQEFATRHRTAADALLAALAAATNPYRQEADDARD